MMIASSAAVCASDGDDDSDSVEHGSGDDIDVGW